jgi:UDP-N-acetylmuramate--alanine ligase
MVISDYAHHPNELISTYQALKSKYSNTPIHVIFQPHQAQRLLEFWNQAVETIKQFNNPIVYQIYAAREDVPALLKQYQFNNKTIID